MAVPGQARPAHESATWIAIGGCSNELVVEAAREAVQQLLIARIASQLLQLRRAGTVTQRSVARIQRAVEPIERTIPIAERRIGPGKRHLLRFASSNALL